MQATATDRLPKGKTCADCKHCALCVGEGKTYSARDTCAWTDSRYVPRRGKHA